MADVPGYLKETHTLSQVSILLHVLDSNGTAQDSATGFMVHRNGRYFLVTNWHVVTGSRKLTLRLDWWTSGHPAALRLFLHTETGKPEPFDMALYNNDGSRRWAEFSPDGADRPDIVVILLPPVPKPFHVFPLGQSLMATKLSLYPGEEIVIVGFPLGDSASGLPLWKTGHLASDLSVSYLSTHRSFVVDITGKSGMSGAPVYATRHATARLVSGGIVTVAPGHLHLDFLGVYTGRTNEKSDLGIVIYWTVVERLVAAASESRIRFADLHLLPLSGLSKSAVTPLPRRR